MKNLKYVKFIINNGKSINDDNLNLFEEDNENNLPDLRINQMKKILYNNLDIELDNELHNGIDEISEKYNRICEDVMDVPNETIDMIDYFDHNISLLFNENNKLISMDIIPDVNETISEEFLKFLIKQNNNALNKKINELYNTDQVTYIDYDFVENLNIN